MSNASDVDREIQPADNDDIHLHHRDPSSLHGLPRPFIILPSTIRQPQATMRSCSCHLAISIAWISGGQAFLQHHGRPSFSINYRYQRLFTTTLDDDTVDSSNDESLSVEEIATQVLGKVISAEVLGGIFNGEEYSDSDSKETVHSRTSKEGDIPMNGTTTGDIEENASNGLFDITGTLFDSESPTFWSNIISFSGEDEGTDDNRKSSPKVQDGVTLDSFFKQNFFSDSTTKKDSEESSEQRSKTWTDMLLSANDANSINHIITKAQEMKWQDDQEIEKSSLLQVYDALKQCMSTVALEVQEFLGEEVVPLPTFSSLQYYFERSDEVKHPSWKRRQHRFFPKIKVSEMDDLNQKLQLARLAYASSVEEVQKTLTENFDCELLFCDPVAKPNKPAHFVAVKRSRSGLLDSSVEVYVVVCGTKTMVDIVTDLLCEAAPYRNGLAHAGIAESGQYLAEKHVDLLRRLCDASGQKKVNVHLLGHSLGAGCAAIAAIEWNEYDFIDVEMTGFGCPAMVSEDVAQAANAFITIVVSDNDCVPRLSLATAINAVLDVVQFDYTPYAQRDLKDMVDEIETFLPDRLSESMDKQKLLDNLTKLLPDDSSFRQGPKERMEVVLYPPGTAIHFFFDGFGVTGCRVPNSFFNELDVTRRMIHDHLYDPGYNRIFLEMMRQYHNDNHFAFED